MASANIDIYELLLGEEKKRITERTKMLRSIGITQLFFEEGNLRIDMSKCVGVECKLCIKACPTNALYWDEAQVKLERDLCIYCSACVINCIENECLILDRRRIDGFRTRFSTPREAAKVNYSIASEKRKNAVTSLFSALEKSTLRSQ